MSTTQSSEDVVSKMSGLKLRTGWTDDMDTIRSPRHVSEMTRVASFHADEKNDRQKNSKLVAQDSQEENRRRISIQERLRTEVGAATDEVEAKKSRTCILQ
ncbi:hypothetical protein Plhal304r1_c098g0174161 [Plasmopara halstedii]